MVETRSPAAPAQPHTVTEVFTYTALPDDPHPVQLAYDLCNIGDDPAFFDPPAPRAVEYRDRANRSLSVGDVVAVRDDEHGIRWYACASFGFDALDQAPVIENGEQHGTTPVDAPLVGYVVTFASPRELKVERWAIEAYAHATSSPAASNSASWRGWGWSGCGWAWPATTSGSPSTRGECRGRRLHRHARARRRRVRPIQSRGTAHSRVDQRPPIRDMDIETKVSTSTELAA